MGKRPTPDGPPSRVEIREVRSRPDDVLARRVVARALRLPDFGPAPDPESLLVAWGEWRRRTRAVIEAGRSVSGFRVPRNKFRTCYPPGAMSVRVGIPGVTRARRVAACRFRFCLFCWARQAASHLDALEGLAVSSGGAAVTLKAAPGSAFRSNPSMGLLGGLIVSAPAFGRGRRLQSLAAAVVPREWSYAPRRVAVVRRASVSDAIESAARFPLGWADDPVAYARLVAWAVGPGRGTRAVSLFGGLVAPRADTRVSAPSPPAAAATVTTPVVETEYEEWDDADKPDD